MSYRVGLSGGIGSGKSTVAAMFADLGVKVIDSDSIAHRLTQPNGEAIPLIRETFGAEYVTAEGAMDRARMRRLVFSDTGAKLKLEAILHPLILSRMLAEAETATDAPYLLLVVPLLFESPPFRKLVQRTLVVDCPEETQIERTTARSSLSREDVRAIMGRQISRAERLELADDILRNEEDKEALRHKVLELHRMYLARSSEWTHHSSGRAPQNN
jgi:dephospho-CoA kinase